MRDVRSTVSSGGKEVCAHEKTGGEGSVRVTVIVREREQVCAHTAAGE